MSKTKSIGEYFKEVNNGGGLPTGEGLNQTIPTPPHSATQRTTSANKLNGVKEMKAQNEDGRVTYIVCTDNGQSLNMDEMGNIFLGCGKIGDDESGGGMTVRPHGQMIVKVGDTLSIEVENKLDEEKPLSLKVFGDINMEAVGGDVHMKGNNVNVTADTELHLKGSKVLIQGGSGAGGSVEVIGNTFKTDTTFINNNVTGAVTQTVFGEYTIRQLLDPRASFNIISSGSMNITAGGDLSANLLARAEVFVAGLPAKPIPTAKSPNAFSFTVGTGNSLVQLTAGNLTYGVTGNSTSTITGNSTSTITGNNNFTQTGNYTGTYSGTFTETVSGNATLTNSGTYTQTIAGVHNLTSSAAYTHNITGTASILAGGVMTISGTQIFLN